MFPAPSCNWQRQPPQRIATVCWLLLHSSTVLLLLLHSCTVQYCSCYTAVQYSTAHHVLRRLAACLAVVLVDGQAVAVPVGDPALLRARRGAWGGEGGCNVCVAVWLAGYTRANRQLHMFAASETHGNSKACCIQTHTPQRPANVSRIQLLRHSQASGSQPQGGGAHACVYAGRTYAQKN